MSEIVVYGTGPMARLAAFYLTHDSEHSVATFVAPEASTSDVGIPAGVPMTSPARMLAEFPPSRYSMLVALEPHPSNHARARGFEQAEAFGYELCSYISSKATIWPDADIGRNCMILERCVVQPFASIGHDVVLSPGCHIGHESVIDDHCFLEARVVISGNVDIGPRTHIRANAAVRNSVSLGRDVDVEAGAMVARSVPDEHAWVTTRARAGADSSPTGPER